jgi:outer membrane protein OmpA-like peptidoglycan-associated protein
MARLQPGLFLKVRGHGGDQKELVAERISFHRSALRVTNQIASGQVELREEMDARLNAHNDSINVARARGREELSALTSRIADLDAYDEKFSGSVRFSTGSAVLSAEAKSTLDSLVSIGTGLNGSLVEVAGFADSRGSPEFNHQLSQRRVDAVIAYLAGTHSVPLRKIVNPTGLGESNPVGSNNTDEGRALNRRVEIRILVNRGMNTLNPSEKKSQDNNAQPAMPNSATPRSTPDTSNPRTSPDNSTEPNSSNEPTTPNSVPMPMTPRDSTKP